MTLAEQESQDGSANAPAPETSSTEGSGGNEMSSADQDGDIVLEDSKPKEDIQTDEEKPESAQALETKQKE